MEAHGTEPHTTLAHGAQSRTRNRVRSVIDEVLKHVVEKFHHVLDELRHVLPLIEVLQIHGRKTADGRTLLVRGQEDFGAKVRSVDLEPLIGKPLGQHAVGRIGKDQVRFAGVHAHFQNTLPEITGTHRFNHFTGGRVFELPRIVIVGISHTRFDLLHEGVGNIDAMMQIECAHIGVARGLAHLNELNDVRMINRQEGRVGPAPRRTLTIRKTGRIVDLEMRHDTHAFVVSVANAHVNADATAEHRKPVDFGKRIDQPFGRIGHVAQKARDRQTALVTPEAQNRRRKTQPVATRIVINALRMFGIARKAFRHKGVALLRRCFPFSHIAFAQALQPQLVKKRIAR